MRARLESARRRTRAGRLAGRAGCSAIQVPSEDTRSVQFHGICTAAHATTTAFYLIVACSKLQCASSYHIWLAISSPESAEPSRRASARPVGWCAREPSPTSKLTFLVILGEGDLRPMREAMSGQKLAPTIELRMVSEPRRIEPLRMRFGLFELVAPSPADRRQYSWIDSLRERAPSAFAINATLTWL